VKLKPYPKYKPSGIEWLGEVPADWDMQPVKRVTDVSLSNVDKHTVEGEKSVQLCNYVDVYKNERITTDIAFMTATASDEQIRRLSIRLNDVIITKDSESPHDIGVSALVAEEMDSVVCGYHLALLRPHPQKMDGSYLNWAMQSDYIRTRFSTQAVGMTRYGLGKYAIENTALVIPCVPEQSAIATFLDRETAKIDTLIGKQEKLIELLQEKRQAVISHGVTKGLDPNVPLKPSGVEWLGDVPEHWEMKRLKFVASVQGGVAKGRDLGDAETIEVPYLRVANVQDGYLDLEDVARIKILESELERYSLRSGDVLMNEGGDNDKLGRGHIWRGEIAECIHQNHVFAVRPAVIEPEWLNAVTSASYGRFFFLSRSKQSTNLASISSSNIQELPVTCPPASERKAIIDHIQVATRTIDTLIAKAQQAIELQKEHRAALISAAVTGKIDVRGLLEQDVCEEKAA
jgi:type I restriction enzyme S subunit